MQYTVGNRHGNLRRPALPLLGMLLVALSGCSTIGYYGQAVRGQMEVMSARVPVQRLIEAEDTDAALRERLERTAEILSFAQAHLALPVERRYARYADVGREDVVYNVVAAPELSLAPRTWCYPVVGCVPYRGYFREEAAERLAAELAAEGFEVSVTGAAAYSTLGWFSDPLLNTFIHYPDGHLANLLIHELAHARLWIPGNARLNESFASFVGKRGADAWLEGRDSEARRRFHDDLAARAGFERWARALRAALRAVYAGKMPAAEKRLRKADVLDAYRRCYQADPEAFGGRRYARAVAEINNARLALISTYSSHEAAFAAMFDEAQGWPQFYEAVRTLGKLPSKDRRAKLAALASGDDEVAAEGDDHGAGEVQCEALASHAGGGESPG